MDQCDSLITNLITMLLNWYSGDIDREELDYIYNRSKENKIIVTGLSSVMPPPYQGFERQEWVKNIVWKLFGMLHDGSVQLILC